MLHGNELQRRRILSTIDGKTRGPKCFNGPIGKQLQDYEKMPFTNFVLIPFDLEISKAVAAGEVSESMLSKFPGNLNHFRGS